MRVRFFGKGVAVYRIKGLYAMGAVCMEMVSGGNTFLFKLGSPKD